jgi:hypothetical protein
LFAQALGTGGQEIAWNLLTTATASRAMNQLQNSNSLIQLLRLIPPKWAFAFLGLVLAYWLTQPLLNQTFGWKLPTIASFFQASNQTEERNAEAHLESSEQDESKPAKKPTASKPESGSKTSKEVASTKVSNTEKSQADQPSVRQNTSNLQYGILKEIGRDRFQSPAGLIYNRGSEEGHRLKHLARHLEDQPTRPGSHGVFDGDLEQVLRWIDEAYLKATKGDRMAKTRREDDSTIYEFTFPRPIGYIGGSEGKRRRNPSAQRIRIVVIDKNFITAFPF